ncbi:MAG: hypothetical protein FJY74_04070 [Candidatus Eisenbacteria bacterium]|nr:hypothetical protein [Candidatus Eisenbacteria bacterium]
MSYTPVVVFATDFDGDGVDEELRFVRGLDHSSYWDIGAPAEHGSYNLHTTRPRGAGTICGVTDLTGDGVPEVVWYEQQVGVRAASVVVTEVVRCDSTAVVRDLARIAFEYDEPVSPRGDWVTDVFLLGAFDLDGNGTREALACAMVTGAARSPRGVWLVNWETGEIPWRRPAAGTPTGGRAIADVDGDGTPEIVTGVGTHSKQRPELVRLSVWRAADGEPLAIEVPPLRARPEDVAAIALHFARTIGREMGRGQMGVSQAALDALGLDPERFRS